MSSNHVQSVPPPFWRRMFHLVIATSTTLLAYAIPDPHYLQMLGAAVVAAIALETARLRNRTVNRRFLKLFSPLLKRSEDVQMTGATHFAIAAFFCFFFFGEDIAVPVLLFQAVGDPIAALVGQRSPGPRPWGKSPVGSIAYVASALTVWAGVCALGLGEWSIELAVTAVFAAFLEFLPLPVDDNLAAPLTAGAVLYLF